MPDNFEIPKRIINYDAEIVEPIRRERLARLNQVNLAPVEAQVAFIKELVKSPEETKSFLKDPKQYAVDHGMLLSPEVVKTITDAVLIDVTLKPEVIESFGPNALKDLVDLREGTPSGVILREGTPTGVVANAAAVAAGAAAVAAAAAVATAVVTLVRTSKPSDLYLLQGLGEDGITLPNGNEFISRDRIINNGPMINGDRM